MLALLYAAITTLSVLCFSVMWYDVLNFAVALCRNAVLCCVMLYCALLWYDVMRCDAMWTCCVLLRRYDNTLLCWAGLGWAGLGWAGLGWAGLYTLRYCAVLCCTLLSCAILSCPALYCDLLVLCCVTTCSFMFTDLCSKSFSNPNFYRPIKGATGYIGRCVVQECVRRYVATPVMSPLALLIFNPNLSPC